ncbi:MAG: dethiobiotin synthase [Gammaproteobacteria bacterium]|nr:dethiobiotin synthase [Gammaproteobacteria bacterium]
MNGVFITGSNTEVGKTTVAIEIVKHLSKARQVKVRKPVETNCEFLKGDYIPKDAIALKEACNSKEPLNIVCPNCFALEASPEEASISAGKALGLNDLVHACNDQVGESFVLVEGAGGFYSPIAEKTLNSDLAVCLQLPVIIVVRDELGAVSQGLLAIEAVKKNNLEVACLVLNEINPNMLSNKESLAAYTDVPILAFAKGNLELFNSKIEKLI